MRNLLITFFSKIETAPKMLTEAEVKEYNEIQSFLAGVTEQDLLQRREIRERHKKGIARLVVLSAKYQEFNQFLSKLATLN